MVARSVDHSGGAVDRELVIGGVSGRRSARSGVPAKEERDSALAEMYGANRVAES